jgi:hypothetical protein
MKLIDKENRSKLSEGRTYGMGFAFCKRTPEGLETVQPISTCKDYLNDVVYAEKTGKPVSQYGLYYEKKDILHKRGYLAISLLPGYSKFELDKANFATNYKNAEIFINKIEDMLKLPHSKIEVIDDNLYIFNFSLRWLKGLYAISLLSLLIRASQWYDGLKDPIEYLREHNYFSADTYMIQGMIPKLEELIEKGLVEENLEKYVKSYDVHNSGILGFDYDKAKTEEITICDDYEEDDDWD